MAHTAKEDYLFFLGGETVVYPSSHWKQPPPPSLPSLPSALLVLLLLEGHCPRRGRQRGHQRMELIIFDLRNIDIFQGHYLDQRYLMLILFVIVRRHKVRGEWYWQIRYSSGGGLRGLDGIRVSGGGGYPRPTLPHIICACHCPIFYCCKHLKSSEGGGGLGLGRGGVVPHSD